MAIQHASIADADRHENKHATGATNGHVLKANGNNTTSFVAPSTLQNITIGTTLEGYSDANQGPSAVDTAYQVTWGAGSSDANVNLASNGLVTISTSGLYDVNIALNMGRTGTTGVATLLARVLINDAPYGRTKLVRLDSAADVITVSFEFLRKFVATDVIKVEILRDSSTQNDGELVAVTPVDTSWAATPSAAIRISKITGGY